MNETDHIIIQYQAMERLRTKTETDPKHVIAAIKALPREQQGKEAANRYRAVETAVNEMRKTTAPTQECVAIRDWIVAASEALMEALMREFGAHIPLAGEPSVEILDKIRREKQNLTAALEIISEFPDEEQKELTRQFYESIM